jgi:transcriptional regulator with XRE-family HTH domain
MNRKYKHSEKYIRLGLNIAYYRKLKGFTQIELAEKANISRTHISNIEAPNMPVSVSLEKLFDIADVLEVSVDRLFAFKD